MGSPKVTRGLSPEGPLYQTLNHSFPNDPLLTCCCHWSLFLVPGNREERRGERKVLKVESEPHQSKRKRRVRSRLQTFKIHNQPHQPPYNTSAHQEVPSIPRPSCVLRRSSQEHLVSAPSRTLTRASSLWGHKVRPLGPGPSSLEKQEALTGSSRWVGVLGAKYAEARASLDPKRDSQYRFRIPSSAYPSLISSYPGSLPDPSGWCLPGSLEPVLSEPDWAGAPGDSSSPPHLTGWWPGLQGQPQTLWFLEPLQGKKRRKGKKGQEGGEAEGLGSLALSP